MAKVKNDEGVTMGDVIHEGTRLSVEDAVKVLQDKEKEDVAACDAELKAVLAKHNCGLQAVTVLSNGQLANHFVQVVKVPAKNG